MTWRKHFLWHFQNSDCSNSFLPVKVLTVNWFTVYGTDLSRQFFERVPLLVGIEFKFESNKLLLEHSLSSEAAHRTFKAKKSIRITSVNPFIHCRNIMHASHEFMMRFVWDNMTIYHIFWCYTWNYSFFTACTFDTGRFTFKILFICWLLVVHCMIKFKPQIQQNFFFRCRTAKLELLIELAFLNKHLQKMNYSFHMQQLIFCTLCRDAKLSELM